jgi:PAS domain S-box-containing protein
MFEDNQGAPPEFLLKTMFAHTRMAMIATDPHQPDNPIVYANEAFCKLTGYPLDEVLGRNCRFLQGKDTDRAVVEKMKAVLSSEEFGYFELLNYRRDGTPFWNALHISPVYDDHGKLTHFFGSQWDVTDQHEAVEALEGRTRLSNERMQEAIDRARDLEAAVDQAKDSILITEYEPLDEPGPRITFVNRGFERMTGYSAEEARRMTPRVLQGEKTDRVALDGLRRKLEAGQGAEYIRTVNYKKDGTPFWIEWSVSPVTDEKGKPRAWLAVQRDVTEQVEAEEERQRLVAELDHRVKNIFSTVMVIVRSADAGDDTGEALRSRLLYQLQALNDAHTLVFQEPDREAPFIDIVEAVVGPFDPDGELLTRKGEGGRFGGRQAVNAAIILYELALMSSECGALSKGLGARLTWEAVGEELRVVWEEDAPLCGEGRFGFSLVKTFVRGSSWKEAGIDERADGFTIRMSLREGR